MKNPETLYIETIKEAQKANEDETAFVTNPISEKEARALCEFLNERFLRAKMFEEEGLLYVAWDSDDELTDEECLNGQKS